MMQKHETKLCSGSSSPKMFTSSKNFIKDQIKIQHHGHNTPHNLELVSCDQLDPTLMTKKFIEYQLKIQHHGHNTPHNLELFSRVQKAQQQNEFHDFSLC